MTEVVNFSADIVNLECNHASQLENSMILQALQLTCEPHRSLEDARINRSGLEGLLLGGRDARTGLPY